MSERQKDIADMQCWVFRMAQSKWKMTAKECAELFEKYDLLGFISECYDLLHVSSYNNALEDVEDILRANGVNVMGFHEDEVPAAAWREQMYKELEISEKQLAEGDVRLAKEALSDLRAKYEL